MTEILSVLHEVEPHIEVTINDSKEPVREYAVIGILLVFYSMSVDYPDWCLKLEESVAEERKQKKKK